MKALLTAVITFVASSSAFAQCDINDKSGCFPVVPSIELSCDMRNEAGCGPVAPVEEKSTLVAQCPVSDPACGPVAPIELILETLFS